VGKKVPLLVGGLLTKIQVGRKTDVGDAVKEIESRKSSGNVVRAVAFRNTYAAANTEERTRRWGDMIEGRGGSDRLKAVTDASYSGPDSSATTRENEIVSPTRSRVTLARDGLYSRSQKYKQSSTKHQSRGGD